MKRFIFTVAVGLAAMQTTAQNVVREYDEYSEKMEQQSTEIMPITPTYFNNVVENGGWAANWFLSVKGGVNAFIGTPTGCGDVFDRMMPLLNISAGKWITPRVGLRAAFQGLQVKDWQLNKVDMKNWHADVMYNVASHFQKGNGEQLPKWNFVVLGGLGIMNNCRVSNRLFALNYGLMVEYRIADRLHVSLEAANTTTWSNWDRNGESYRLGDHMLQLSAGLTYTIGKNGWKKVVDPAPYIHQNDLLMEKLGKMQNENNKLNRLHKTDAMALEEMRKILEIEGLLDKYELIETDTTSGSRIKPKNSYSGLNSLRSRLRNKNWNGEEPKVATNEKTDSNSGDPNNYFHLMKDGKVYVGAPIFIFFKLGTDELTEKAQIINIKEIASTINKYGMYARVVGAADSQTGAAYTNEKLSEKRADYVAKLLVKHGVAKEKITQQHRGGISSYEPMSGNRNTCVMLYYTEKQGN